MLFSSLACTKSSKFERGMIVRTHAHDGENKEFFLFFQGPNKKKVMTF